VFRKTIATPQLATERVTVRHATDRDERELTRLTQLDSSGPIKGPSLVAESDARILAALPLGSGRPVADPFEPTAELVALLELRAAQLREERRTRRGLRRRVRDVLRAPLPDA
jgi:hypothetical protein